LASFIIGIYRNKFICSVLSAVTHWRRTHDVVFSG